MRPVFQHYPTEYVQCETGVYVLVGTMPEYMNGLLFASEAIARAAKAEAERVLGTQQPPDNDSPFVRAWYERRRLVRQL